MLEHQKIQVENFKSKKYQMQKKHRSLTKETGKFHY